jgi:hypothetical protein
VEARRKWLLLVMLVLVKRRGQTSGLARSNELYIVQLSGCWE